MNVIDLFSSTSELSLPRLAISLLIGAAIAELLRQFFIRYARSTSDAHFFSRSFAPLLLSIILIIAVIRTSLALSLGLVGALSIVRFRTPIKDPEELIFLLMVIAAGIGLGAEQWLATSVSIASIIALLWIRARPTGADEAGTVLLDITSDAAGAGDSVNATMAGLTERFSDVTTVRAEASPDRAYLSIRIRGVPSNELMQVVHELQQAQPGVRISAAHTPARLGR